jgi:hypothetical protein
MDWQVGGTSRFKVSKDGTLTITSPNAVTGISVNAANSINSNKVFEGINSGTGAIFTLISRGGFGAQTYYGVENDSNDNFFTGSLAKAAFLGPYNSAALQFMTNGIRRVTIDTNGNFGFNTNSFGTSAVGSISVATGTAPTTSPAGVVQYYAAAAATNDAQIYARTEAGQVNRLTGLSAVVGTQFDKTSDTTLANVTNLTRNVEAGRTYAFTAVLYTTSNSGGGVKAAIGGTATATSIIYQADVLDGSTQASVGTARATSLGTAVGDVTAVTAARITISGTIVVNAAGTLTVQFAQNASNGTASSVLVNSTFTLTPVT